jgi:AcrR family transcriptional regulator
MAQFLKEVIEERIRLAALEEFSARGFNGTTIASVARRAGISTGNVYHYYHSKRELFEAALPMSINQKFLELMRGRVSSLSGVTDFRKLAPSARFFSISEELLQFCLDHRLQILIMLKSGQGTQYESLAQDLTQELTESAIVHFRQLQPNKTVTPAITGGLALIYRNFLQTMVQVLTDHADEPAVRELVEAYSRYHLAGLNALFE